MFNKEVRRKRIQKRIRKKVNGTTDRPRLSIFRSNKNIYCQLIDDLTGRTITAASSKENGIESGGSKSEQAKKVGLLLAEKAKSHSVETIVFDRSGYLYHGRVKSLAEGIREGGLTI